MNEQNNATEITKIYLVTNCYGDPNKVYIGKTAACMKRNGLEALNFHHKMNYNRNTNFE